MDPNARTDRPDHTLAAPLLVLDLAEQLRRLHEEPTWRTGSRNAVTLVKNGALRVVLVALHAGAAMDQHSASGPVTVQVVAGRLQFTTPDADIDIVPGQLVALEPALLHEVTAREDSAILLTVIEPA